MIFGPCLCGIYNQNCHCQCITILHSTETTKNQELTFEVNKISKTQSPITTTTILTENTSTTQKTSNTDNKLSTIGGESKLQHLKLRISRGTKKIILLNKLDK
jgi:hypothetical protein